MKMLSIFMLVLGSCNFALASFCSTRLGAIDSQLPTTEALISYLTKLTEQRVIGAQEIQRLIDGRNPLTVEQASIESAAQVHLANVERQLGAATVDRNEIIKWAQHWLDSRTKEVASKAQISENTKSLYERMTFVTAKSENDLGYSFEVMTMPITQKQWTDIMGQNPSLRIDGEDSAQVFVNGRTIQMKPDNPIDYISWWSALEFANRLSIRSGFDPVYDFTKVKLHPLTSASNGTLDVESQKGSLLIIPSISQDVSKSTGYRLPTEEEYQFLVPGTNNQFHLRFNEWGIRLDEWVHNIPLHGPTSRLAYTYSSIIGSEFWVRGWNRQNTVSFRLARTLK